MLILTRRYGETFTLKVTATEVAKLAAEGKPIDATVQVTQIRNGSVRLGIAADKCVHVLRSELKAA